jgi:class 3 adenylate cyclase
MQTSPTADPAPPAESALRDAVDSLRDRLPRLAPELAGANGVLRRDLVKFADEAALLDAEVNAWFPVGSPSSSHEELRAHRHDARNLLNHLFGLAQLIRLGDPAPEVGRALDEAVAALETCLGALSRIGETGASSAPEAAVDSTEVAPEPGSAGTLLIADDDPENREILRRLLEPRGFHLSFAVNGVETIAKMEREDFDAVLLDIRMPEMDGFEVLSRLRETGRLGNTPVIVVTGLQEEQDAVRCIENGAEDFLSRPIRPALLMARLSASLEKKRLREKVFEQHFTPELARELARNPDPMKMQARQAEVTVMFCDIRGFSAVSERLGPAQTIAWLGGVMGEFSSIVIDHGGVLVDYTGDELLAMWGAPNEQPDHALLACRTALEILDRLPELNEQWHPVVGAGTEVGIGINSGEALVGNVGTHRKFKYGPLGTAVNLASRVQGATKFLKTSLLLTGETAGRVRGHYPTRRLCRVRVQNINAPVDLHDLPAPGSPVGWIDRARIYEEALDAFERGDFAEADTRLGEFLALSPGDGPARGLKARIEAERTGLETEFDPVWSLPGK